MFCPKCGTQNVDIAKFCKNCGESLPVIASASSANTTPPSLPPQPQPQSQPVPPQTTAQPASPPPPIPPVTPKPQIQDIQPPIASKPSPRLKWVIVGVVVLGVLGGGGYSGYTAYRNKLEQQRVEAEKLAQEKAKVEVEKKAKEEQEAEAKRLVEEHEKILKAETELENMPDEIPLGVWKSHGGADLPPTEGSYKIIAAQAPGNHANWSAADLQKQLGRKVIIYHGYFDTPFHPCNPCGPQREYKIYSVKAFLAKNPSYEPKNIPGKFIVQGIYTFIPGTETLSVEFVVGTNSAFINSNGAYIELVYEGV